MFEAEEARYISALNNKTPLTYEEQLASIECLINKACKEGKTNCLIEDMLLFVETTVILKKFGYRVDIRPKRYSHSYMISW